MAAGYDELTAHRLAAEGDVDVHLLVTRRERGLAERDDDVDA